MLEVYKENERLKKDPRTAGAMKAFTILDWVVGIGAILALVIAYFTSDFNAWILLSFFLRYLSPFVFGPIVAYILQKLDKQDAS